MKSNTPYGAKDCFFITSNMTRILDAYTLKLKWISNHPTVNAFIFSVCISNHPTVNAFIFSICDEEGQYNILIYVNGLNSLQWSMISKINLYKTFKILSYNKKKNKLYLYLLAF